MTALKQTILVCDDPCCAARYLGRLDEGAPPTRKRATADEWRSHSESRDMFRARVDFCPRHASRSDA